MSRDKIIERLVKNSAEIITAEEFMLKLDSGQQLTHYIGFEISGYVHIGQGIMSALVMKDLTDLGVKCTVWLADWHTWLNDKLDGSKETAAAIGQGYFTEAIKACYLTVGGNPDDLEFRLASTWYAKDAFRYMELEKLVEKHTTLSRIQRSISIMGRDEGESIDFAKLTYPAMQAADIIYQNIDIAHSATDQRKAHVIMRDVFDKITPGKPKPIALHQPLIESLSGDSKMSKSKPDGAVFIHDTPEAITKKINKAFCPEKDINHNPVLNWVKHLLFHVRTEPFRITRQPKHGGDIDFNSYEELEKSFAAGDVHPMDLKAAVTAELIALLKPARDHFEQSDAAAKKQELDKLLEKR